MSEDVKNLLRSDAEPTVRQGAQYLPMWIVGLLAFLLYWGCNHVEELGGKYASTVYEPFRSADELASLRPGVSGPNGKAIFESNLGCAICHGPGGMGTAQAPSLVGSEWVLGSPNRMIPIPLVGLTGPIHVKDTVFNGNMFAPGANLKDDELAAALTYIRSSWGNKASAITPEQVQKIREEFKGRTDPLTEEELLKRPE